MTIIYPAVRAVEHATAIPGLRPLRFFAVLWPLWQVEATADTFEEQAYELLDRLLARAIFEGGFDRIDDLRRFFGLPAALVERCLVFLSRIRHVDLDGPTVRLTDLGRRSVSTNIRYVERKSTRLLLLVEPFTRLPLPRSHYHGALPVLSEPRIEGSGTRFRQLFCSAAFRPEMLQELAVSRDRAEYNLPIGLSNPQIVGVQDVWLPAYLIETVEGHVLAYTAASDERDCFLERACRDVPVLAHLMDAEGIPNPRQVWTDWLAQRRDRGQADLDQLPSGVWRATFRAAYFRDSPLKLFKLGSFELHRHHFLQLWSNDEELRRRAVLHRSVAVATPRNVTSLADLSRNVAAIARQLEVAEPGFAEVRAYAVESKQADRVAHLDYLE